MRGLVVYMVKDSIHIRAPIERCYALSVSVDLAGQFREPHPTQGSRHRFWKGWFLGIPRGRQTSISLEHPPTHFRETVQSWQFKHFQHDHHFAEVAGQTLAYDKVRFSLPLGWFGKRVARRLIVPFVAQLLRSRLNLLKTIAESGDSQAPSPKKAI